MKNFEYAQIIYYLHYISSTQIPAGGFEITIRKHNEPAHDPIVTITGYDKFVLF